MWTPTTRRQHRREGLRHETDLTTVERRLIEPMPIPLTQAIKNLNRPLLGRVDKFSDA